MPIYAYRCSRCGHAQDVLQRISDPVLTVCPNCGEASYEKQVTAAGFQLKGSGWYVTDFRDGGGKKADKKAEGGDAAADAGADKAAKGEGDKAADKTSDKATDKAADKPASTTTSTGDASSSSKTPAPAPAAGKPADKPSPGPPAAGAQGPPSIMRKYLVAGLLVWLPLAITIWVLSWLLSVFDGVFGNLLSVTQAMLPESLHGPIESLRRVPGLGVIVLVAVMLATGVFAANIFGQWALRQGDRVFGKIPIVKSIYNSVKQVSDTLFSSSGNAFREAVLVQYPRHGSWTIAFVTGRPQGEVAAHLGASPTTVMGIDPRMDWVSVYVPTTPNPTSGFFLMMPRADVVALAMSVDEALKYVISMGVVAPPVQAAAPALGAPARN